jgi:carbamoyl-phosphate synthase large subunit
MPCRTDIKKILLIGSGPIIIGQACEFDYSGTQGAKSLKSEGYEVVLVNSNPATIMTDPELADRTYVEPLTVSSLEAIIEREKPDALLPTLGGQTALNLALALDDAGVLSRHGVELIGASKTAIRKAEDRGLFKAACDSLGLATPKSAHAHTLEEARLAVKEIGYPAILRPSFTLGGSGGGIVYSPEELDQKVAWALSQSPTSEVLIEQSVIGWKEYELEVISDSAGNFSVICTIENIDAMGVHTGDSVTVAPAMTLTDREFQRLRDAAKAIMREIGVATGGANVQFAVNPANGDFVVIEMNPRVSRSSALASKATGYPIAKVAAKLAVGYTLDEIRNDITGTSAAFEPTIDYVVVKWPRFTFEKFQGADARLGTQMKSVGEAMSIGRTFCEAFQKAARSLETGRDGLSSRLHDSSTDYVRLASELTGKRVSSQNVEVDSIKEALRTLVSIPNADRLFHIADLMRLGSADEELNQLSHIDPWFLSQIRRIVESEAELKDLDLNESTSFSVILAAKRLGFSDRQIARLVKSSTDELDIRNYRLKCGIIPSYSRVDTCAAEFVAHTPYMYSTYESTSDIDSIDSREKVIILGGGPNRIGQGIEFDYCCVHATMALRELGYETIMVNCNPETVSTDYDTSDRLYFEPLTLEDVLSICDAEAKRGTLRGVVVQLGGQTPLKLAKPLAKLGIPILGTPADTIDRAEDRERFDEVLSNLGLRRPRGAIAHSVEEALEVAQTIGFPLLVRPSYVLGGRAMMIVADQEELTTHVTKAFDVATDAMKESRGVEPVVLLDEFLRDAIEVDVDSVCDGERVVIAGVMQHIEEAGIHSGDSTSVLPPHTLPRAVIASIKEQTRMLAMELGVRGLMNVQFAVINQATYVLEVNPRASRTVPFVSKALGVPWAKIAAKVMSGRTLSSLDIHDEFIPQHVSVKESVFPFVKFPGADIELGPEMRSTGEVMGISNTFDDAFGRATVSAGSSLPKSGFVLFSVKDEDKPTAIVVARKLHRLGFHLVATPGTADTFSKVGLVVDRVSKIGGLYPSVLDRLTSTGDDAVVMVFNTAGGVHEARDSYAMRRRALNSGIPYFTTMSAALAVADSIVDDFSRKSDKIQVRSLQEWHEGVFTRGSR